MKKIRSIGIWPGPRVRQNAETLAGSIRYTLKKVLKANTEVHLIDTEKISPPPKIDVMLVLGGDGTISGAAKRFAPYGIPLLGVNYGDVGFLCAEEEFSDAWLKKLLAGDYLLEDRLMLEGRVLRKTGVFRRKTVRTHLAFGEITVKSTENNKMVTIAYSIDGHDTESVKADGMMVATPSGSTGYSLSCGGPILMPTVANLIINAIAPHTLHFRPIVVGEKATVRFLVAHTRGQGATFWADMQENFPLEIGDEIAIAASPVKARLIFFEADYFFQAIKTKLR